MANKREYFPYLVACQAVHELKLSSRSDYIWWHKRHKPKHLPRFPNRVYEKEWVSWNDWLGNNNVFKKIEEKPLRPFWEAVKWAQEFCHKNNLNTSGEWIKFTRGVECRKRLPDDIPPRPDVSYLKEWKGTGWTTWLGINIRGKLIAAANNVKLLAICSFRSIQIPGNMIEVIHATGGMSELKEIMMRREDLQCNKIYRWDPEIGNRVQEFFKMYGMEQDDRNKYLVRDYNQLIFELDSILDWHRE